MDFDYLYKNCRLCYHRCGVDRTVNNYGRCKQGSLPVLARAALHFGEEPVISGTRGSGTVFFSGCSLGCIYCQNADISHGGIGRAVLPEQLSDIMLKLEKDGAHNINFVTPTHFIPSVVKATETAKSKGLNLPIVYNTSSFECIESIDMLLDTVNVYLADMKYMLSKTSEKLSFAGNYPDAAKNAIARMVEQRGRPVVEDSIMTNGVIVRVLLLPGHSAEAKLIVSYLLETYGDDIFISLMSQYTPMPNMPAPLNRTVSHQEYEQLCDYALKKGLKNGFYQDRNSASGIHIPDFDFTGI